MNEKTITRTRLYQGWDQTCVFFKICVYSNKRCSNIGDNKFTSRHGASPLGTKKCYHQRVIEEFYAIEIKERSCGKKEARAPQRRTETVQGKNKKGQPAQAVLGDE